MFWVSKALWSLFLNLVHCMHEHFKSRYKLMLKYEVHLHTLKYMCWVMKMRNVKKSKRNGERTTIWWGFRSKLELGLQILKPWVRLAWGVYTSEAKRSRAALHASQSLDQNCCPLMYVYLHACPLYYNTSLAFFTGYSVVYHLIKRSLAGILLQVVYFQKADHVENNSLFLVVLGVSPWGKVRFCCVSTAEWVTGGDWAGAALLYASATEGSANFCSNL